MDPYERYAAELARLVGEARGLPLGGLAPRPPIAADPARPPALILSPHPDDECIVGGLALRLQQQAGLRVVNVAVTQGSDKGRQGPRWDELRAACRHLGFELVGTRPGGLERIDVETRSGDPRHWDACVDVVARILAEHRPSVLFFPHAADWNSTHVGTHHLGMDALARQPAGFACTVVETEYWGPMAAPNLMVEIATGDLAHLMAALSFHVVEVERNPYHVLLPAWMMDNVRRGSELVGGQGGAAPDFTFATLYRASRWQDGRIVPAFAGGRTLPAATNAREIVDL